jgi:hypothetical protein
MVEHTGEHKPTTNSPLESLVVERFTKTINYPEPAVTSLASDPIGDAYCRFMAEHDPDNYARMNQEERSLNAIAWSFAQSTPEQDK